MNDSTRLLAALALGAAATGAAAEGLDGKSRMICAATQAVVCQDAGDCVTGADGSERSSAIDTMNSEGGKLVMQGSDEGFGWSLAVDAASGRMLLAGGKDVGYLVFGECTAP